MPIFVNVTESDHLTPSFCHGDVLRVKTVSSHALI